MALRGQAYLASLAERRVAVVGLARSGVAAARLLVHAGAEVVAIDAKPLAALGAEGRDLTSQGVTVLAGEAGGAAARGAELVVVSPGVPLDSAQLAEARAAGVPVIGELELGWRATEAETIAITGTNGKTTTTALTGALLAGHGRPLVVAGNIGSPVAAAAVDLPAHGLLVLEVSSFQLETIEDFAPRVAAVLNVTPDHLDRHGSMARYVEAKARIFTNQRRADWAVLNADDELAAGLASRTPARIVPFSRRRELEHGVFVRDGSIVARLDGQVAEICPVAEIFLRGQHNVENVLAATACALWAGLAPDAIRRGVRAFRGVAHRIEPVRELAGVQYYNDSKGTNVASTIKALESFDEPVLLIAGGVGKGQDFTPLADAARGRVVRAVLIGQAGPEIGAAMARAGIAVTSSESLGQALDFARATAPAGGIVLLSPACASFDMFDNYEHRGDVFKDLVRGLA